LKNNKQIKQHVTFWSLIIFTYTLIHFFKDGNSQSFYIILIQNIKRLPAMILTAYVFNDILLPRFYNLKKYIVFAILFVLLFYIASVLDRIITVYVYETFTRERPFPQESIIEIFKDVEFLFLIYVMPLFLATFAMTFDRIMSQKRKIEKQNIQLERDRNLAELKALKSQINPHFLFNTLNNLYALTLQKSDKAPESIKRLSEMLDYMLYQCNDKLVPLHKEIELLKNYIALEQLRYGDDIKITFNTTCIHSMKIAPFILLSIIENAFKHGASHSLDNPEIHIKLSQKEELLYLTVKNTRNETPKNIPNTGIGMSNIKQQLELLYPDFEYNIIENEEWYEVQLIINTVYVND